MSDRSLSAVFMRGGTSKALVFHETDLPEAQHDRDACFLAAIGSPDPNRRQLNGMGGGVSSLSKICIVAPSGRSDADIDYTFGQVQIDKAVVDYSGNCGNMSSAIGPFAVDEGLIACADGEALVRIHNTNTGKIIHSRFLVEDGQALTSGPMTIPGVHGSGSPIALEFLDPGGAVTGKLLPTGNVHDTISLEDGEDIRVTMVDAANPCVFVSATDVGLHGNESPDDLDALPALLAKLGAIRESASVAMGITTTLQQARDRSLTPFVVVVAPPAPSAGQPLSGDDIDLLARALSSGQPHRALPLTVSLCTAIAAKLPGSVVHALALPTGTSPLRLGTPSGVIVVDASVRESEAGFIAERGMFFRTARRLFKGLVFIGSTSAAATEGMPPS